MKRLLAMLLCIAMLLSMAGCKDNKGSDAAADQTAAAVEAYTQAIAPFNGVTHITLEQRITTVTTVDGDDYSEQSTRRLTYQATGTEDAIISSEESLLFSVHDPEDTDDENQAEAVSYQEIWHKDTLYTSLKGMHHYQSTVSQADAAKRYTPVILLNGELYEKAALEATETDTVIRFSQPKAAEAWALPQGATLVDASGTAKLTAEGKLIKMEYTVTYQYGPAKVKLTVESKPLDTPQTVSVPANKSSYITIAYADALRASVATVAKLKQLESLTLISEGNITSEAAGYVQSKNAQTNVYGHKDKTISKRKVTLNYMDYASNQSDSVTQEEVYLDGKLTTSGDNGLPTTNSSITWKEVRENINQTLTLDVANPDYWKEVSVTDTGFAYLLEFKFNENFGNTLQNVICTLLWNDPSFLLNLSENYTTKVATGYLSIDKYTGLPIANGYSYEGLHYIEGKSYSLIEEYNGAITIPSKGAYKEITGKLLPEKEPENKATPLFYKVTGKDGQQMYLFGTIHVGDERTAYLPEAIRSAFNESDALAIECNNELFEQQLEEDKELAVRVSAMYFGVGDAKPVEDSLQAIDYQKACQYLKAAGGYNTNMPYAKAFVWTESIENYYLQQGYALHANFGVEERLIAWAKEQNKEIREIESVMAQLKMFSGFSSKLQAYMLTSALETESREYWEEVAKLYESWCTGDEAVLREMLASEWDPSDMTEEEIAKIQPLYEEYHKKMDTDRNKGMLKTAIEYLESDQVVFYAVGLAHLLDAETGLVDALQQAGYTVEKLTY